MNIFLEKNPKTNEAICIRNVSMPFFQGAICTRCRRFALNLNQNKPVPCRSTVVSGVACTDPEQTTI